MPPSTADFVRSNQARFLEELNQFLRIPSISTLPEHKDDVARAAQFTADSLKQARASRTSRSSPPAATPRLCRLAPRPGAPTVSATATTTFSPGPARTLEDPSFEPTLRDGNIYARGSADDKGQMYMHVKAVETLMAVHGGKLPVNLKFLVEGEEEIGGKSIAEYVPQAKEKLKADVALVSDTALYAEGVPTLCIGLRGLVYMEIEAKGPGRDLHSGLYGGAAPNAVYGLIELLGKAKDADGRILIPGFYDDVAEPAAAEIDSWKSLPFDEAAFLSHEVGASRLTGEPNRMILERVWSRPTLEVHGIAGGFTGAGAKTVIPAAATAKVSMRLVPDQEPEKMFDLLSAWVAANAPQGVELSVRKLSGAPATVVNPDHPAIAFAAEAFEEVMQAKTVFIRSGGSIPIVGEFAHHLGIPTVLMGFGLPDDGLHSPNEKYKLENFYLGIRTVAHFFEKYGASRG